MLKASTWKTPDLVFILKKVGSAFPCLEYHVGIWFFLDCHSAWQKFALCGKGVLSLWKNCHFAECRGPGHLTRLLWESTQGPLEPEARIMPLDQAASNHFSRGFLIDCHGKAHARSRVSFALPGSPL